MARRSRRAFEPFHLLDPWRIRREVSGTLDDAATVLASSTLGALALWGLDLVSWRVGNPKALFVSGALYLAIGGAVGVAFAVLWFPVRALARSKPSWAVGAAVAVAVLVTLPAARQAFGPVSVARSRAGSIAIVVSGSVTVALVAAWGLFSVASTTLRTSGRRALTSVGLPALGLGLLALDQTVLSPTFEKTYSFVEGLGHLFVTLSIALLLRARAGWLGTAVRLLAVGASAWVFAFAYSRQLRVAVERALPAVWEEPAYSARWVRRARRLEVLGRGTSDVDRVAEKYDLKGNLVVDARWNEPVDGGAFHARGPQVPSGRWNLVVFFVDTLRADVAHDPAVMPETCAWMRDTLQFSRAYSSGSSTVLTLAPMLGCRYDAAITERPMLLQAAREAGLPTRLVIPSSASDYHRVAFPGLRFDEEEIVDDSDRKPTASAIVDRSLSWLQRERPESFFLWLYHFDVHGWEDLAESYVEEQAREGGFSKTEGLAWRYRAAARAVDRAFARFRSGLAELGLSDHTIVVFASDHGEALGKQNFWRHSTYLWESLVRVPLALHVPGQLARTSDVPVSTVDLATTLVRFLGPQSRGATCHGEDLLSPKPLGERRLPILFSSMVDGRLARVGMLAGVERKLVVDVRDADARLLRLRDGSPTEEDISASEPHELTTRLSQLVRTPIYPRQ